MATTKIIQSLERASKILELFQDNVAELSLRDITERSELNKSTVFGIVNSLTSLGYLTQNPDNQHYALGPKILFLASSLKLNNLIIRISHPYLEELSEKYQETIHSAVYSGDRSVIYLDKVTSTSSVYINTKVGIKNYMYCTGVGKCILSYMNYDERDDILEFPLASKTYNTFTERDSLYRELDLSRDRGYSMDNEEIEIGLTCIAVPVFSSYNTPGFAISVAGPTSRIMSKIQHTDLIQYMQITAGKLSKELYQYSVKTPHN